MAAYVWAPMARTADRLIADENAPLSGEPAPVSPDVAGDATPPQPDRWRWVALGMTMLAALTGIFAAWRVYDGSAERNRWLAVIAVAALVVIWGIFTFRLIVRSPEVFGGL